MQVGKEPHLHLPIGELLHPHPQEAAQVAYEASGACRATWKGQPGSIPIGHAGLPEVQLGKGELG